MTSTISAIKKSTRKSATLPGVLELREICNKIIDDYYPEYRFTTVELELNKHGHRVMWGVPNRPIYMSIEFLWAYAKRYVCNFCL